MNAEQLVKALKDVSSENLTARPFNRFKPEASLWWLTKSTKWPLYRFGKIFIDDSAIDFPDEKGRLMAGFYIERGLSSKPAVAEHYPPALIMRDYDEWQWVKFQQAAGNPGGIEALQEFFRSRNGEVFLKVLMGIVPTSGQIRNDPDGFNEAKQDFLSCKGRFWLQPDGLLQPDPQAWIINYRQEELAEFFQQKVKQTQSVPELLCVLEEAPKLDWIWIDLLIGFFLSPADFADMDSLWSTLRPWMPWMSLDDVDHGDVDSRKKKY